MSDLYEEDGWLVVVITQRMGGGRPLTELYAVATKEKDDAAAIVQKQLSEGESIYGFVRQPANVMQGYSLFPGKWSKQPVINP